MHIKPIIKIILLFITILLSLSPVYARSVSLASDSETKFIRFPNGAKIADDVKKKYRVEITFDDEDIFAESDEMSIFSIGVDIAVVRNDNTYPFGAKVVPITQENVKCPDGDGYFVEGTTPIYSLGSLITNKGSCVVTYGSKIYIDIELENFREGVDVTLKPEFTFWDAKFDDQIIYYKFGYYRVIPVIEYEDILFYSGDERKTFYISIDSNPIFSELSKTNIPLYDGTLAPIINDSSTNEKKISIDFSGTELNEDHFSEITYTINGDMYFTQNDSNGDSKKLVFTFGDNSSKEFIVNENFDSASVTLTNEEVKQLFSSPYNNNVNGYIVIRGTSNIIYEKSDYEVVIDATYSIPANDEISFPRNASSKIEKFFIIDKGTAFYEEYIFTWVSSATQGKTTGSINLIRFAYINGRDGISKIYARIRSSSKNDYEVSREYVNLNRNIEFRKELIFSSQMLEDIFGDWGRGDVEFILITDGSEISANRLIVNENRIVNLDPGSVKRKDHTYVFEDIHVVMPWVTSITQSSTGSQSSTDLIRFSNISRFTTGQLKARILTTSNPSEFSDTIKSKVISENIPPFGEVMVTSQMLEDMFGDWGRGDIEFIVEAKPENITASRLLVNDGRLVNINPQETNDREFTFAWVSSATQGESTGSTNIIRIANQNRRATGKVNVRVFNTSNPSYPYGLPTNPITIFDTIPANGEIILTSELLERYLGDFGRADITVYVENSEFLALLANRLITNKNRIINLEYGELEGSSRGVGGIWSVIPWVSSATQGRSTGTTNIIRIGNRDYQDISKLTVQVMNSTNSDFSNFQEIEINIPEKNRYNEIILTSSSLEQLLGDWGRGDLYFELYGIERSDEQPTISRLIVNSDRIVNIPPGAGKEYKE